MRFRIEGQRLHPNWDEDFAETMFVEAADADSAARIASRDFTVIRSVLAVPEHTGRGPFWRFARWLITKAKVPSSKA